MAIEYRDSRGFGQTPAGTQINVGRLQRALQLTKEKDEEGVYRPIPRVTYDLNRPLTCVWDTYTEARARAAAAYAEAKRQNSPILACTIYGLCDRIRIDKLTVSADRKTIWVEPKAVWDVVKRNGEDQIREHGMRPCASVETTTQSGGETSTGSPASSTSTSTTSPEPEAVADFSGDTEDAVRLDVARLASGLFALGLLEGPFAMAVWDQDIADAYVYAAQLHLGYIPAVTGRLGDECIFVHMRGATSKAEALAEFLPLQEAFNEARQGLNIRPPADRCIERQIARTAAAAEEAAAVAPAEAGMGLGGLLIAGGIVGAGVGLWWLSRR